MDIHGSNICNSNSGQTHNNPQDILFCKSPLSAQTGKKKTRYRLTVVLSCGQQSLKTRLYTTPAIKLITFFN